MAIVGAFAGHWLVGGASLGVGVLAGSAVRMSRRPVGSTGDTRVARGVALWDAGSRTACEIWLTDIAGETFRAHATRTSALTRLMAEQLAVPPEQMDELMLAGLLHVLPAVYAETGQNCGEWPAQSLDLARAAIASAGHEQAARAIAECQERWDGSGAPNGLLGEACTVAGRILVTACAFDRASTMGLEFGLTAIREGSGSKFDPVVAAELLYLFTEPWQLRQVA